MHTTLSGDAPLASLPYVAGDNGFLSHFSDTVFSTRENFHPIVPVCDMDEHRGSGVQLVSPVKSDVDRAKQDIKREEEINKSISQKINHNISGYGARNNTINSKSSLNRKKNNSKRKSNSKSSLKKSPKKKSTRNIKSKSKPKQKKPGKKQKARKPGNKQKSKKSMKKA